MSSSSKQRKGNLSETADDNHDDNDDYDDSASDSDDDDDDEDDLILEGVLIRNPDVSDSDDTSSEEDEDEEDEVEEEEEEDSKPPPHKKSKASTTDTDTKKKKSEVVVKENKKMPQKKKKKRKPSSGPEIVHVEFIFCDMNEKFFHGLKTLLSTVSPLLANHSSALSDLMIENASIGTVTSTEGDTDGTVFGFASVLNVTTHQDEACIQSLKQTCLDKCPPAHQKELQVVLSGKTKRPAGFYLHGRMVNMPLEIVQVLHEQLVVDMDWAVQNARGSDAMRKSLDFGAFLLFAPTFKASAGGGGGGTYYKFFDDEIFANHAEFTFEMELPKPYGSDETPFCNVVVMTKTGHRNAMKSLAEMVGSGGPA